MIKAKKILRLIRSKVKDNNEVTYSDYDVLDAMNECIRYINMDFAMKNSDFLERIKRYRQDEMNAQIAEQNKHVLTEAFKGTAVIGYASLGDINLGTKSDINPEDVRLIEPVSFSSGVDLPEDFLTLVSVIRAKDDYHLSPVTAGEKVTYGGYKVFAGRIYCGTDFDLAYRASIQEVNDVEADEISLPTAFTDIIVKVSCMILQNSADTDVMMGEISKLADSIVPARRYSNVKRRMPFIC